MSKVYAVRKGRKEGIFSSWGECQPQVTGFKGAEYKSFSNMEDAQKYLLGKSTTPANLKSSDTLDPKEVIAYIDGSFDDRTYTYSYGVVLVGRDFEKTFQGRGNYDYLVELRNVAGELEGALVAINEAICQGYKKIHIHYDYLGIQMWATRGWKANTEGTKVYQDIVTELSKSIEINFIKVKAHTGVHYNEMADKLAKTAPMLEAAKTN